MGLPAGIRAGHGGRLGFVVPKLHVLHSAANKGAVVLGAVPGFHDVVAGVNGACPATPGWDHPTGLGSYDVAKLSQALR